MKFTSFELDVMQYLWQQTEATSPEVHTHITNSKDVTYSTVKPSSIDWNRKGSLNAIGLKAGRFIIKRL